MDIAEKAKTLFHPFTDIRTGVEITTPQQEIDEVYRLTNEHVNPIAKVDTVYGLWLHGNCPYCNMPIDNWYHKNFCGNCGGSLDWTVFTSKKG